jgi:hypothetical protein
MRDMGKRPMVILVRAMLELTENSGWNGDDGNRAGRTSDQQIRDDGSRIEERSPRTSFRSRSLNDCQ